MEELTDKSLMNRRSPMILSLVFRHRGALSVGDRHLRRARVPRHAADEGDRHPHRARQQCGRRVRAGKLGKGSCSSAEASRWAPHSRRRSAKRCRVSCLASARPIPWSSPRWRACWRSSRSWRARSRRAGPPRSIRSPRWRIEVARRHLHQQGRSDSREAACQSRRLARTGV